MATLAAEQGFKELLTQQKGGRAPADFDAALLQLLSLVVTKPELKEAAAAKLTELAHTLSVDSNKSGPNDAATSPLATTRSLQKETPANAGSPLEKLKKGFLAFKSDHFLKEPARFEPLKTGQSPKVLMIACCDSRVAPETVLSAPPGEVFVVRNIANIVPPMEEAEAGGLHGVGAALEYAVLHLKVEHIVVAGHRACGGIKALMTMEEGTHDDHHTGHKSYIGDWVNVAAPAKRYTQRAAIRIRDPERRLRLCEKASVNYSMKNLLTFPWIKEAVDAGRLTLHGWYYDFVEGALTSWTLDSDEEVTQ